MDKIVGFMLKRHYAADKNGVCWGLALMAERAREQDNYDEFAARIAYLNGLDKDVDFNKLVEDAQNRYKNNEALLPNDNFLIEIDAFFLQLSAHHQPEDIQNFLGVEGHKFSQDEFNIAEKLFFEEKPLLSPKRLLFSLDIKEKKELDNFYNFLKEIITSNEHTGLVLSTTNHTIHFFYDYKNKKWKLTNHSDLQEFSDMDALLCELFEIVGQNNIANIAIDIFSNKLLSDNFFNKLKSISKNGLDLLTESKNIDRADQNSATVLHIAAKHGCTDIVKILLANGASVDLMAQPLDVTALVLASQNGNIDIVKLLLEKSASPHLATSDGRTPLFVAADEGHVEVIKAILNKDPSTAKARYLGMEWMEFAIWNGRVEVVNAFIKPGIYTSQILNFAIKHKQIGVIQSVLNKTILSNETSGIINNIWEVTKPKLKRSFKNQLIPYIEAMSFSDKEKDKKTFFIEIAILMANDRFTLEKLIAKLEQYQKTHLFHKSLGSPVNSRSAKLIKSLFSELGISLNQNQMKKIAEGEVGQIKKDLFEMAAPKPSQSGLFSPKTETKSVAPQPPVFSNNKLIK